MKSKHIQDMYLQTLIKIKCNQNRSKSDSTLSVEDHLETNLPDDEDNFLAIQDEN